MAGIIIGQHQVIMNPLRIFISSVQREFTQEREVLRAYLHGDPLMQRFFDVFLFEDVPALDCRPDALYLDEVEQSDIYVGCSVTTTDLRTQTAYRQQNGSSIKQPLPVSNV